MKNIFVSMSSASLIYTVGNIFYDPDAIYNLLLGLGIGLMGNIHYVRHWSIQLQFLLFIMVSILFYILVGLIANWFSLFSLSMLASIAIFGILFVAIWFITYKDYLKTVSEINQLLKELRNS
ncbi:DUF3021 family protein [Enterococcus sp. LJL90]